MIIEFIRSRPALKKIVHNFCKKRAFEIFSRIKPFLKEGESLLDVGSGFCIVSEALIENRFRVVPLDIKNLSCVDIKPVIYDGKNFPFKDNSFDVVLIFDALHHTSDPEHILREAKRVSDKKIIVGENIYSGVFHRFLTMLMDRMVNFDFSKLSHKNDSGCKVSLENGLCIKR